MRYKRTLGMVSVLFFDKGSETCTARQCLTRNPGIGQKLGGGLVCIFPHNGHRALQRGSPQVLLQQIALSGALNAGLGDLEGCGQPGVQWHISSHLTKTGPGEQAQCQDLMNVRRP